MERTTGRSAQTSTDAVSQTPAVPSACRAAVHVLGPGPVTRPGHLEDGRQSLQGRMAEQGAQPASPMVPSPMFSWRSRLAPNGTLESFRWRQRSRSSPIVASKAATTASASSTVANATPEAHRCWVSRHTPRPLVAGRRSSTAASSSKLRPTVPPAPAAFSSRIGQGNRRRSEPALAVQRLDQHVDHLGRRTLEAQSPVAADVQHQARWPPCPRATARLAIRQARDVASSSGSAVARLMR